LPIFNFSLEDVPGEIWKPIPGLEEFAHISQFGRVKRLARTVVTIAGVWRFYDARILKAVLNPRRTCNGEQYNFGLGCSLSVEGVHHFITPARFVYHLFKAPFEYKSPRYAITSINGNDLDIRPENLQLGTAYVFQKKRPHQSEETRIKRMKKAKVDKSVLIRRKVLSCYNHYGDRKATYNSIEDASALSGLPVKKIASALQSPFNELKGYYWRNGKSKKIDLTLILKEKERLLKRQNGHKITQFDLNGIPINFYFSIQDAAHANGIDVNKINSAIVDGTAAGFFFRRNGHLKKPIKGL